MKELITSAKKAINLPVEQLNKMIAAAKYERMLKRVEKENEELLMGYDSPLLHP